VGVDREHRFDRRRGGGEGSVCVLHDEVRGGGDDQVRGDRFADSRVRCNAICPGRVETPWVSPRISEYSDPKKAYEEMAATQALRRMGTPEEVAAAAVYLASDEAAFVTGSALILDGGWTAGK